ncbi:MAG TPA: hypothetical protein ENI05_07180 [Porticoccus sp.]|nr:hypothetical protein [Porticoccus sp.]
MSSIAKSPLKGLRPTRMKAGISRVEDLANGQEALGPGVGAKTVYYCDGNAGNDNNSGVGGWENAYKTLATAMAASHADIALNKFGWAARNVIYCRADWFVEDLVALPQKTDVIGVGSADGRKGAGITGNHAPVNTTAGCRFFNFNFQPTAAADLWILTNATSGLEFWNCRFLSTNGATVAVSGIDTTASTFLKVIGCEFSGQFSADYIDIGAGAIDSMVIMDNIMSGGSDNGIMVTDTATVTATRRGMIIGNFIECADIAIDVNSTSLFNVFNNRLISGEAVGSGSYVIDLTYAVDNILTGNDISVRIPSVTDITT